jgi:hypothetical protein
MFIRIRRVGGFAGIDREVVSADTATWPEAVVAELRQHLGSIAAIRARAADRLGADHFEYAIDVRDEPAAAVTRLVVTDFCDPREPMMKHVHAILALLAATDPYRAVCCYLEHLGGMPLDQQLELWAPHREATAPDQIRRARNRLYRYHLRGKRVLAEVLGAGGDRGHPSVEARLAHQE